jgi:hypothetical protein
MSDQSSNESATHDHRRDDPDDDVEATIEAGGRVVGSTEDGEPLVEGPNPE